SSASPQRAQGRAQARGAPASRAGTASSTPSTLSRHDRLEAFAAGGSESAESALLREASRSRLARRHHLLLDERGLAVPCRVDGSVQPQDRRLGDRVAFDGGPGAARAGVCDRVPETTEATAASHGSRQPVRQPYLSRNLEAPRSAPQHEPEGQLLGQRADGELVLLDEDGARLRTAAADARGLSRRDLRVHRDVLQSGAAALVDRLPEPRRVRAQAGEQAVNRTSRRPVETAGAAENAGQRVSRSSLENASRFPQFPQALCDEELINLVSTESGQGQAAENAGQRVSRSSLENASRFPQF